ncbi:MAG: ThuA domain-containing protein [Planctomycetia bacterium]|nr:ThuA domain-containing protein [Planctomycetia bacterium]
MKRRQFLKQSGLAALTMSLPMSQLFAVDKAVKILYFERSSDFVHAPTIDLGKGESVAGRALRRMGRENGFEVDCTKEGTIFDGDLDQYAAFVFYTCGELEQPGGRFPSSVMSKEGIRRFYHAIREKGKGFLGIHSAVDTWKTPGDRLQNQPIEERTEYIKMIGGQFYQHGHQQEVTLSVIDPTLPWISKQGKSFRFLDEWYSMKNFAPDLHVILAQETDGMDKEGVNSCYDRPRFPSTWARKEGKGRIGYTAVGHNNESWDAEVVPGLVTDLIGFVTGRYDLDLTPNLTESCPGAAIL